MTTTTDVTMARRFREIPARGIVPDESLIGCAHGLVVGLASLADAHQKAGKF